ncbi:class I SAM-dependent DNA methyltransferase [Pseudooceanicola nanhaiensis]|uniref:class I SAM-dependent DNA methyltransferase n=1 Tax=Pseudooceanicola nanhaiensis TaxID=375761 RepID=UPI001CD3F1C7|nr:methyltransferase [Pseudooceanicola nanhaiensis]MCA0918896.1 methyltransferase domain-containing protein [Pseudooceanicola nanhaiensis]
MAAHSLSSGNLIVDRRLGFAEGLARAGDSAAAADLLTEALGLTPDWAAGWFRLGEFREAAGDAPGAIAAWQEALRCDPSDRLGAGLKRDLIRRVPLSEAMPSAFVEALFDQYATKFETALVDQLDYCAPDLLRRGLEGQGRFARMLDLGCGTGLAGVALRDLCDWMAGYDISAGMLAEARAKGIYDLLEKRDLSALEPVEPAYDLIVAADVFIYLGALEQIVSWCVGALRPGGTLAFTVERGEAPVALRDSRRFAHSADYVAQLLQDAGFADVTLVAAPLRRDRGAEVEGLVVTARRAVRPVSRLGDGEGMALA